MEKFIRNHAPVLSHKLTTRSDVKKAYKRRRRSFLGRFTRSRKKLIRFSLVSANLALLCAVWFVVSKDPAKQTVQLSASAAPLTQDVVTGPLDQVSSADIAVHIARVTGLPERDSVTNHADTVSAVEANAPADTSVVAKPQVVGNALPTYKDIKEYTAVAGDTIASIAAKFGVSSDSVRWSNGLSGNNVAVGKVLVLPPAGVNGVVYTVASGDTPDSLAQRFTADKDLIVSFNDAEVSGLKPGQRILIPNGIVQAAPVRASTVSYTGFAWGTGAVYSANGYDYGWCTWHAANRRREIGRPIPSNLGNAISWYYIARNNGMAVGDTPAAGAVIWHARMGGLGHVGFVEKVNDDGTILVSDMNYPIWGRVTYRTIPPSEFGQYKFIY
jgi:surface antigen